MTVPRPCLECSTLGNLDLVIVGAGPAGLGTAAHAAQCGLQYVLLERSQVLAETIDCYQKGKRVMAEPSLVPTRNSLPFEAGTRESVLGAWADFVKQQQIKVEFGKNVDGIERQGDHYVVSAKDGSRYETKAVVIAVGTQGNPNRLRAEGEDLPQVKRRLVDPKDHQDDDIVVIGAGDSALEIANSLADENRVTLVVRKPEITRAKEANEREAMSRMADGTLNILFSTTTERIEPGKIFLKGPEEDIELKADTIYVKIGAQPPRRWLESLGIKFASEERDAQPVLSDVYESRSLPGVFLIGAVMGRDLIKFGINQGYEVVEHLCGRQALPADEELLLPKLPLGRGTVQERLRLLQKVIPLFADTDADQLQSILMTVNVNTATIKGAPSTNDLREAMLAAKTLTFSPGQPLMRQNDYTDSVMIMLTGKASVLRANAGGVEKRVGAAEPGAFFGEMGLLSGRRRSATIVADEETTVIEFPRKTALNLILKSPRVRRLVDEAFLMRAFEGYLFPDVPREYLRALAKTATLHEFERGASIVEEGSEGDGMWFIRSGQVQITRRSDAREIVLAYLKSGNFFGEEALWGGEARNATVSAIFPTQAIFVARSNFQTFLQEFPNLADRFRAKYEERRLESLAAEAKPGGHPILDELIRGEVVIGTDALIIDDYKCIRCGNCVAACEGVHDDGQARLSLTGIHFANILAPNSCWQCENPLCMLDCPPDALVRDSRGEIYIRDNCIGCGNCESNCPYGNIFMVHPQEPRLDPWSWVKQMVGLEKRAAAPDTERTIAVKCDLCRDLPAGPACVSSCPTGAALRLDPDQYEETIGDLVERGRVQ